MSGWWCDGPGAGRCGGGPARRHGPGERTASALTLQWVPGGGGRRHADGPGIGGTGTAREICDEESHGIDDDYSRVVGDGRALFTGVWGGTAVAPSPTALVV